MQPKSTDAALTIVFSVLIMANCLLALSGTSFSAAQSSPIGGGYQRVVEDRFEDQLPLRRLSIEAWSALRLVVFGQAADGALVGADDWLFTKEEFTRPPETVDFRKELASVSGVLSQAGVRLVPVIIPDKARIYADHLGTARSSAYQGRYKTLLAELSALGLPVLDLQRVLSEGRFQGPVFMKTDTHWSPLGARLAAELVADALGEHGLTKTAFSTHEKGVVAIDGDLRQFVPTGVFRAWVGPGTEMITRYEEVRPASSAGLFGDAFVPVTLVGTSFSARPEFLFEPFLREALQLDVYNVATGGLGPFAPMRDYLGSEAFSGNPPKFVIWEIPERYVTAIKDQS